MESPYAERLMEAMATAASPEERAIYGAELACYRARTGYFELAENLKRELRSLYGDARSPHVSILLICLDALLLFYRELSIDAARQRMRAANLLSMTFPQTRLTAYTSAWMALLNFNLCRYAEMRESLKICFDEMAPEDSATEFRASLTVADALSCCGDAPTARHWYERARRAANALGDHAAIAAITYNRANFMLNNARLKALTGSVETSELSAIGRELQNAVNYQAIARIRSLDHLLTVEEAGLLVVQGKWLEAEPRIRYLLSLEIVQKAWYRMRLQSELAMALAKTGRCSEAADHIISVPASDVEVPPDDLALAAASFAEAAAICGHVQLASNWRVIQSEALAAHETAIATLRQYVAPYAQDCPIPTSTGR